MKFIINIKTITLLSAGLLIIVCADKVSATTITYADFSSTVGLKLNKNSAQVGNVLRITPAVEWQGGSAFLTNAISLSVNASFSTEFQFRFTGTGAFNDGQQGGSKGADGLVFVLQTVSNNVGGSGGGIGYKDLKNSVGIEFDTWNNGAQDGGSSNHIGFDFNGDVNSLVRANVTEADMNNGNIWTAWIDYDGSKKRLEARLNQSGIRPVNPILSMTRDLVTDLGTTNAYIGFTSGTGLAYANHDVLNWTFVNNYVPIKSIHVSEPYSLVLLSIGFAGLMAIRRNKLYRFY
jgi:hypothetical protein